MNLSAKTALSGALVLSLMQVPWADAGDKVLVLGDSLTKEYQSEFVALYPTNPEAWGARNWIELLDSRRHEQFDLGPWQIYPDWRLTGHEYNWARPGGTARDFRNFVRSDAAGKAELQSVNPLYTGSTLTSSRATFNGLIPQSQRMVLFLGGNDLALGNSDPAANPEFDGSPKQIDYESIYAGTFGAASEAYRLRDSIRKSILSVLQYLLSPLSNGGSPRYSGAIVLCSVPHVGCTPKVQQDAGTDPGRTAVLTEMIEILNDELRFMAATTFNIGFADIYPVTKEILDPGTFRIGGVSFIKEADADCGPRYLFSGDGFHPNTAVHAKVAQIVGDAFSKKYPELSPEMPRLTDREIITEVLGLPGDIGYVEWMTEAGVPVAKRGPLSDPDGDGLPNLMEYLLAGRSPDHAEQTPAFTAVREQGGLGEVLTVTWQPRFAENAYADLGPQTSSGSLMDWQPVEPSLILTLPDGSQSVSLEIAEGNTLYFRLAGARP